MNSAIQIPRIGVLWKEDVFIEQASSHPPGFPEPGTCVVVLRGKKKLDPAPDRRADLASATRLRGDRIVIDGERCGLFSFFILWKRD